MELTREQLIRTALAEAIYMVSICMESVLPDKPKDDSPQVHEKRVFWMKRLAAYRALLKKMGGRVRGQLICAESLDSVLDELEESHVSA
jgi:hypothetical protein